MATSKITSIELTAKSNRTFFLIHGYTGSPTDFSDLPQYLHERFNANVRVLCLKGHGTTVQDLDTVTYEDLWSQVTQELEAEINQGQEVVVGGFSFGAPLALRLAAAYPVRSVIIISSAHRLRFPFMVPGLSLLGLFKKEWKKKISLQERELRKHAFYYDSMHANGARISRQASRAALACLHTITAPILSIYSEHESLSSLRGVEDIKQRVASKVNEHIVLDTPYHNPVYSELASMLKSSIGDFVEKHNVFGAIRENSQSVSAVVPCYNEEVRIGRVLECLSEVKSLKKIVVVDDGSSDNTANVVRAFPKVTYVKNEVNRGKGFSMNRGVAIADSDIIFFCDADLQGLTPQIVEEIIAPVVQGQTDMFIGIRSNWMQRAVPLFAYNSGERALSARTWRALPDFYKRGYRIEAGLNHFVKKYGKGFRFKIFNHYQTLKEVKYGFFRGAYLRWKMNVEVLTSYLACVCMPLLMKRKIIRTMRIGTIEVNVKQQDAPTHARTTEIV